MEVPVGFVAKCWSFISFLPFFFSLFILGFLKGLIVFPVAASMIAVGNSAVAIGLWPAHFVWTYYCVAKSKRVGWILKILVLFLLPIPLILWPVMAIAGSILGGVGFGFFAPLIATFEAVGVNVADKCYHCFMDGLFATLEGSCTVVRDFTDFCFHSYFSYMDELSKDVREDEKPVDIEFSKLPGCFLVSSLAVFIDVPLITLVALWKSPYMLFKGWKRLLEDLIGREGPFLETVCVPFAGLAILLWPLAVLGAVLASFFSSFFLSLYAGVIVHQEDSLRMGLAYIVAVISLFDEYANDLLSLAEGSCFPRPQYRKRMKPPSRVERMKSLDINNERDGSRSSKLISQGSRTLKEAIQQYTPMQVWDWFFKSCEVNGKMLLQEGLIGAKDIQACMLKGDCKKLGIQLPAWSILQRLLISAKSDSSGLIMCKFLFVRSMFWQSEKFNVNHAADEMELTRYNLPKDKVSEWFISPLFTMKEQIKGLQLQENEESCLKKLVLTCNNDRPEDWDESGFPSTDKVRRAQLQAVIRRLQGIVGSMSRLPTFRRRFRNLVKVLYVEAIETDGLTKHITGSSSGIRLFGGRGRKGAEDESNHDNGVMV